MVSARLNLIEVQVEGLYYHQEELVGKYVRDILSARADLIRQLNGDPQPSTSAQSADISMEDEGVQTMAPTPIPSGNPLDHPSGHDEVIPQVADMSLNP